MSSSLTLRPTMSQSASRWPATASLRSSFCFRRTVSAARTATFSGRCFAPPATRGAFSRASAPPAAAGPR
ncbi:hypothetical protein PR202_ga26853 [Eleusine coracana subsp. coracana]|uniref:Uncharacterized protein n=1 Tax=Eleusine coracana subsp. coracana TaxID=191504 RepID=A0AAV5DD44_ELECO|nr:hypothetical protein PR202_ga26853 [Eleusine coracana subsp. coracana]